MRIKRNRKLWICLFATGLLLNIVQFNGFSQSPGYVPTFNKTSSPYSIFAALAEIEETTLFIFAPNGEPLYQRVIYDFCYNFRLHPNGLLSYFEDDIAGFVLMDSLFNPVDTIRTRGFRTDYHELRITGDGSYLLIGLDPRSIDMSAIFEGGNEDATVVGNVIQKLDAQKNLVFQWNSFDYFDILDSYADKYFSTIDYVHFNAIEEDTDSTLILSSRNMSELTRINIHTGDIIWRLGGRNNQFEFQNFDRNFSGQHAIRRKQDQVYTLYDNGLHSEPKYSMGVEFVIDEDSMSVEKIREFRQDPDVFSPIMGNLQNLDNGNTLVSWGGNTFTEYDAEHQIVHEGIFTNCDIPTYGVNKYRWQNKSFVTDLEKVEFASAGFGDTLTEVVHIQNHLSEELVINEFKLGQSSFYVNPDTITIQSGGQARLEIHFSPERNGNIYDTLTIRSNRADRSIATQLILSGTGSGITTSSGQMGIAPLNYYPVPFQEFIRYSSHKAIERIEITDMTGRMVLSVSDLEMHGYIDTGKLEAGSYFVTTHYFDKTKNQSIIIKSSN